MNHALQVVVVEDNDALREATVEMLEDNGFVARGMPSAEDVDDTPGVLPPDIYVIDLNLPGEDGLSLALRLRKAQPKVGIVITTARTLLDDRLKGYESGADIYLPKPVDPKELLLALKALAQRLKNTNGAQTGITLNKHTLVLKGPASECKISDSEARVLIAFASAKDRTLERWQVATQMNPGNEAVMSPESMQARLSQLRKKLTVCGADSECIKAIRNAGYRLTVNLQVV